MPRNPILRLAVVGAVLSALVTVSAPVAHARWGQESRWRHELDLGVRTSSGWTGFGLSRRVKHPSAFVIERHLGHHATKTTVVRMRKVYQRPGPATIRGCDRAHYVIEGVDRTRQVTDGGYSMTGLEVGYTTIRVIVTGTWASFGCPITVASEGHVHDALTLRFVGGR